jgi:DNA-binding XRE family transcriptional regulator
MHTSIQTLTLSGQRFVVIPEDEYLRLTGDAPEPALPPADAAGNRPAVAAMRVMLARDIIRARRDAGLTQAQLANLAGVRVETVNRLEAGKHSPNVATVDKIHRALEKAAAKKGKRR